MNLPTAKLDAILARQAALLFRLGENPPAAETVDLSRELSQLTPLVAAIEELSHAKTYLEREGLQAELIPALGDPAETIAEVAKEHDADLIVVGTHEPSVIGRLFGQSVTEAVVHKVHCDVLIVHPGHH